MAGGIRIASVVFELLSIVLLCLLLATPVRRHPVVTGLLSVGVLRSLCAIIPALAHGPLLHEFTKRQPPQTSDGWWRFCAAEGVLLRYLTIVKGAYAFSITVPMLQIARQALHSQRAPESQSRPTSARRTRLIAIFLTVFPFVYAIPTLAYGIHAARNRFMVQYLPDDGFCDVLDPTYYRLSEGFVLAPFLAASLVSSVFIYYIVRFYTSQDHKRGFGILDVSLISRFGIVTVVCFCTSILLVILVDAAQDGRTPHLLRIVAAFLMWESISPLLFFLTFAAQENVIEYWSGVIRALLGFPIAVKRRSQQLVCSSSQADHEEERPWNTPAFARTMRERHPSKWSRLSSKVSTFLSKHTKSTFNGTTSQATDSPHVLVEHKRSLKVPPGALHAAYAMEDDSPISMRRMSRDTAPRPSMDAPCEGNAGVRGPSVPELAVSWDNLMRTQSVHSQTLASPTFPPELPRAPPSAGYAPSSRRPTTGDSAFSTSSRPLPMPNSPVPMSPAPWSPTGSSMPGSPRPLPVIPTSPLSSPGLQSSSSAGIRFADLQGQGPPSEYTSGSARHR